MDKRDIERAIDKILWGKSIVFIDPDHYILRSLTIKETNYVDYLYDRELRRGIDAGIPTEDEVKTINMKMGLWSPEQDEKIEALKRAKKQAQSRIMDFQYFKTKKKKEERKLAEINREIERLLSLKESLFTNTAENRAEEIKRRYMVFMSTETMEEEKCWKTERDFLNETNNDLIFCLATEYVNNNLYSVKDLRQIARSPLWRFRWSMAKTGTDLFGKPISEWAETQNMLVYWSQYYDFIFESPDRPADHVLEDDDACDAWVERQSKKIKSGQNKDTNMFGTKKAKTTKDHQEQFIMAGDKESVEEIQSLNDETARMKWIRDNRIIRKEGNISEWKLRRGEYEKNK